MRRANSVVQQDRVRRRNGLSLDNTLLNRRKKLNFKGKKTVFPDLSITFNNGDIENARNVRRYPLRGHIEEVEEENLKKLSSSSSGSSHDFRSPKVPESSPDIKRRKPGATPGRRGRHRKFTNIKNEESFAYCDSSDEEMPVKRKKLYTVQNGEQCAEMYKTDFGYQDEGSEFSSDEDDLIKIKDRWKEDWNQGVQVPVNKQLPEFVVRNLPCSSSSTTRFRKPFQMPDRLISAHSRRYVTDKHVRVTVPPLCQYQCDRTDVSYSKLLNERRLLARLPPVELEQFTAIMERFEIDSYQAIHHDLLAPVKRRRDADHDDETCCEICGQADYEEDDPIVFCEICMVPVHQSCYGVEVLPKGDWICDVCREFDVCSAPVCVFCPFSGGAMKTTEDGDAWAHISCALWIPEVRFGNHIRREPISKIDDVPNGRWKLRCTVCDTSVGACIQCSKDVCTVAFHVTCALRQNFVMRIEHADTENVRMLSFCREHSKADYQLTDPSKLSNNKNFREKRVVEKMEEDYFLYVSPEEVAQYLNANEGLVDDLYEYWKLKRADKGNSMLLTDRSVLELRVASELSLLFRKNLKVDYELRHDLEKVRNLCHMVKLRERYKTGLFRALRDAYNIVYNCIANSHVPLSGRVLKEYRDKLDNPYFNDSLKGLFADQSVSFNELEGLLDERLRNVDSAFRDTDLDERMSPVIRQKTPERKGNGFKMPTSRCKLKANRHNVKSRLRSNILNTTI